MKHLFFLPITFLFLIKSNSQNQSIEIESVRSLYLELFLDSIPISTATGFIIKSRTMNYLVTNYHVITNKNPINGKWLDSTNRKAPNRIFILHNGLKLGEHVFKTEPILDKKGYPLWVQYNIGKEFVDVVALPLKDTTGISIFDVPYTNSLDTAISIRPTSQVFILGFPFGIRSASEFPIWKSGTIASEPDIDQENKPIIWVDASTFPGMSGSPVYIIGNQMQRKDGGFMVFSNNVSVFLGVFSHAYTIAGALWKASYLKSLFDKLP